MRPYKTNRALSAEGDLLVEMRVPGGIYVSVAVEREVKEALDDLQREWWRIERREARHTLSLDAMLPLIMVDASAGSESLLLEKHAAKQLASAVSMLSPVQARRLLMHELSLLPIREIAEREGCSERAVKYSLNKARKKLREILGDDFPLRG